MDYRHRAYYLVKFDGLSYDMRIRNLQICVPSIKIHPPYNHMKNGLKYDGDSIKKAAWQMLVSCRKEHEEALRYELRKAERRDLFGCIWLPVFKDVLGH